MVLFIWKWSSTFVGLLTVAAHISILCAEESIPVKIGDGQMKSLDPVNGRVLSMHHSPLSHTQKDFKHHFYKILTHLSQKSNKYRSLTKLLFHSNSAPSIPTKLLRPTQYLQTYKRVQRVRRQSNVSSESGNVTFLTPVISDTPVVSIDSPGENQTLSPDFQSAGNEIKTKSIETGVIETSTVSVTHANTTPLNKLETLTNSKTSSQINPASGNKNKASVTELHTTPLSATNSNSHALINSTISMVSKYSVQGDNVTSKLVGASGRTRQTSQSTTVFHTTTALPSASTVSPKTSPQTSVTTQSSTTTTESTTSPRTTTPVRTTASGRTTTVKALTESSLQGTELAVNNAGSSRDADRTGGNEPGKPSITNNTTASATHGTSTPIPEVEPSVKPEPEPSGKPKPEPSGKPEPEPKGKPEPEPKGKPEPEPELNPGIMSNNTTTTGDPAAEPDFVPFAEPIPDWPVAKKVWKEAWPIHIYSLGTAFALLAVFSLISIIRLWRIKHLFSQKYFISLNLLMFLMGFIRAIYLLIDGYNSENIFPRVLNYFLFSTGFPCLTSAFSILFFALLQATRMQLVGPKVQKLQVLITIIVCHFVISIVTDVVVGYFIGASIMLFLCELVSIIWGLFLVIGYCYIFRRLYAAALKRQRVMERLSNVRSSQQSPAVNGTSVPVTDGKPSRVDSSVSVKPSHKYTLSLAVKVTLGTALLGLVFIGLEIYGMVGVFGVFSQETPEPWPWWGFEFGLRVVELLMCVTMSYIGTQPFRYVEGKRTCRWCFFCAACGDLVRPHCGTKAGNDHMAWEDIDPDLINSAAEQQGGGERILFRKKKGKKGKTSVKKPYEAIQLQVNEKTGNGHAVNGHVNPSLESSADSRPVSMLVVEDGFIRFRNDAELVQAMSSGEENSVEDCAVLTTDCNSANELVTGAPLGMPQTNANTNSAASSIHSMTSGDRGSNSEHVHGIVNDAYSAGADSSRNSGVLTDAHPVLPLDLVQLAEKFSADHSDSSMQSHARSNFSQSIEEELQNLLIRKPCIANERAQSATNLHVHVPSIDDTFINALKFTPPHANAPVNPQSVSDLQCLILTKSTPCSPVKSPLQSPSDKRKLLSRSNSDNIPIVQKTNIRTKIFNNAKYFSLSDLELQIKTEDHERGLEQRQPPQYDPVKLLSSRKVSDSLDVKSETDVTRNGSSKNASKKKRWKTRKSKEDKSRTGDSDHSEC